MVDSTRLEGRVVAVTGGGSGIGKGACERIADEGARVAVLDKRIELAEAVAGQICQQGGEAIALACDVTSEEDMERAVARVAGHFGSLYGMVANAGTAGVGWIHETTLADWEFVLRVNLTGAFLAAKHAIPYMLKEGRGSYVVTSSIAGSVIGPGGSAASYAVSKAGVMQLAKQIAVDYGPQGIRANAIQPSGVAESNLGQHAREDRERQTTPAAKLPRGQPWQPIARQGHPYGDYGATIAFLLSDDAAFITGTSIL
ncbi:MAG: SDR family oxidoreductase, partial [Pseudomonadales bacterium]|nr:SDR family oxidoreductase [Pseudomonadales bacterium]